MSSHPVTPATPILQKKKKASRDGKLLFLLSIPCIVCMLVFNYFPVYGWIYAFFDYKPGVPRSAAPFVGLGHFREIFNASSDLMGEMGVMLDETPSRELGIVGGRISKMPLSIVDGITTLGNMLRSIYKENSLFTPPQEELNYLENYSSCNRLWCSVFWLLKRILNKEVIGE